MVGGGVVGNGYKIGIVLKKPILNTIVQIGAKIITGLLGLVVTGLLIRKLGVKVFGQFMLISSVMILLDALADFGSKIVGVREMAAKGEEKEKVELWREIWWLRLKLATITFGLGLGLVVAWGGFREVRWEALVALSMIWLTTMAGSMEIVFQERLRMDLKVIGDILLPLLFLGLVWNLGKINLLMVLGVYWVARLISLVVAIKIGPVKLELRRRGGDKEAMRRLLKEMWPMGIYLVVFTAYDRAVDSMMIERMVGISEVAWYGVAYKIYIVLLQPAYFFVSSIFPILSSKSEEKRKLFKIAIGLLIIGGVGVMVVIWGLAPMIIRLLAGSGFGESVRLLRILLGAVTFSYLGHLFGFSLISRREQKRMLKLGLVVLIFNIGMNWLLIGRIGVYGAAWVTVMTEALGCGLMAVNLMKIR